jgi:hypothetical protein
MENQNQTLNSFQQSPVQAESLPGAPQQAEQLQYEPQGIPAEQPSQRGGKVYGIFSIICATISLLFIPILFGPVGIILGVASKNKGEKTLGLVGIILSAVFMVIGIIIGVLIVILRDKGIAPSGALILGF